MACHIPAKWARRSNIETPLANNVGIQQSRDSSRTQLHLHSASHADLFEEFTRIPLLPDMIFIAPQYQPPNPEDEDDVVPDQHAAFGIAKATDRDAAARRDAWRDLRLEEVLNGAGIGAAGVGGAANGAGPSTVGDAVAGAIAAGVSGREGLALGPVSGAVRVPVAARAGMRGVGSGDPRSFVPETRPVGGNIGNALRN
jgi:hypothetical protein